MSECPIQTIFGTDDDEQDGQAAEPLTASQAQAWREKNRPLSASRVLGWQVLAGVSVALAAWGWSESQVAAWSALYGSLSVVLPSAVFSAALAAMPAPRQAASALVRVLGWEFAKLLLCAAMLAVAPSLIEGLSWPAVLVGLIVTLKEIGRAHV